MHGGACFAAGARWRARGRASYELDGAIEGTALPPVDACGFKQPKTKGRSLAEIQEMWERTAARAGKEA